MSYVAGDRMISWPWFRESLPCVPPATPRTLPLYPAGPLCLKGICHSTSGPFILCRVGRKLLMYISRRLQQEPGTLCLLMSGMRLLWSPSVKN